MPSPIENKPSPIEGQPRPVCPVCRADASLRARFEEDSDGPGGVTYVYMECAFCGIRSRELVGYQENRAKLMREWLSSPISLALRRGWAWRVPKEFHGTIVLVSPEEQADVGHASRYYVPVGNERVHPMALANFKAEES